MTLLTLALLPLEAVWSNVSEPVPMVTPPEWETHTADSVGRLVSPRLPSANVSLSSTCAWLEASPAAKQKVVTREGMVLYFFIT